MRAMTSLAAIAASAGLVLGLLAPAALAKPVSVKIVQTWSGRVPLGVQPPLQSSIDTPEALQQVWTLCQVKGDVPAIDFAKRLVLVAARRGSTVQLQRLTLDDGNLITNVVVSPDMPAYSTCALALVERTGVRRVNGAPLGR
jgi:hypothetical protein